MASARLGKVVGQLYRWAGHRDVSEMADRELLDAFARRGEEPAFEALLRRHGPMVLAVCRRVLGGRADVDDAFQATFLVLVLKARSIRNRDAVASWLHGVAARVAGRARADALRREALHRRAAVAAATAEAATADDLRPVLDEELGRLPEKYRAPLVLCYLEGKTHEQAAEELGWPSGSMSRRLARARELLRQRLVRRGVALSAGLFALLEVGVAEAGLPAALAAATLRAGALAGSQGVAAAVPSLAAGLAKGVLRTMFMTRVKTLSLAVLACCLLGTGVGVLAPRGGAAAQGVGQPEAAQPAPKGAKEQAPKGAVVALAFAPDGKTLATAGDGRIRVWDVATRKVLREFAAGKSRPVAVAFAPDGRRLATAGGGDDGTVRVWDPRTGQEVRALERHGCGVMAVVFSPDGKLLVSGCRDAFVRLWDAETGKEVRRLKGDSGGGHAIAIAPDGRTLASGDGDGVRLWDTASGRLLAKVETEDMIEVVAFAPDGQTVAAGGWDGPIQLLDAATGQVLGRVGGRKAGVTGLAWSPDGKALAWTGKNGSLRLWDPATRMATELPGQQPGLRPLAFSPDGKLLAYGDSAGLHLWDVAKQAQLPIGGEAPPKGKGDSEVPPKGKGVAVTALAFAPDGRTLAAAQGGEIRLWDAAAWKVRRAFRENAAVALAFSPDGRLVATAGGDNDKTVRLWDPASGLEVRRLAGHEGGVAAVAFSPDGKVLATGGGDKSVRLWDVAAGKEILRIEGHRGGVVAVAFSPDGRIIASGDGDKDGDVRLWEAGQGRLLVKFRGEAAVAALAFAPDARVLAFGSADGTVRLMDAASGKELLRLTGHKGGVTGLAYSPDGKRLASAGKDGKVRLWDVTTGTAVELAGKHRGLRPLAFSPDARLLVYGDAAGLHVWDVVRQAPIPVGGEAPAKEKAGAADGR